MGLASELAHAEIGPCVRDDFSYLGFRVLVPPLPPKPIAIWTKLYFHRTYFILRLVVIQRQRLGLVMFLKYNNIIVATAQWG